jgi:hypothetical protein
MGIVSLLGALGFGRNAQRAQLLCKPYSVFFGSTGTFFGEKRPLIGSIGEFFACWDKIALLVAPAKPRQVIAFKYSFPNPQAKPNFFHPKITVRLIFTAVQNV